MRSYFILVFIFLVSIYSCKNNKEQDLSLNIEEYKELGMPDYSKVWSFEEYSTALVVLLNIKNEKPYSLPIKDSKKSGELFNRITNLENMQFLKDNSLPLHEKAHLISTFLGVYEDFTDLYANVLMKNQYYHRELLYLYIFGLNVTQKMLDLADEINESEVPADIAMQSGYKSIQGIYLSGLGQTLENQKYVSLYPKDDLEVLTDSISSSVRRNMSWFDLDTSESLKQKMHAVMDSTSSEKIKTEYANLIDIL